MNDKLKDFLKEQDIDDLNYLSNDEIKKLPSILKFLESEMTTNEVDQTLALEFYKFISTSIPKRLDALNKKYDEEKDTEILKLITEEVADILDRVERKSDKQREWLTKLAVGTIES